MKKYKILAASVFFIFVLVYIMACNQNNLSEDVTGYRIIRTPIPKVTLKDTGAKIDPYGISYTELGYKKSDLPYDEVRNFYSDVSIVRSGKKYGLINSNLERVIPLEYNEIIRASYVDPKYGGFGNVHKIFYAQKGNKWITIELNVWEMWEFVAFGKSYNTSTDMFLLENCSAVVVDRNLLSFEYDGRELLLDTKEGFSPLPMLNGAKFDLYNTEGQLSGTVNAKLSYGHYADTYMLKFSENEEEEAEIALLSNGKAISYVLTEITDTQKYDTAISTYKKDNSLQNAIVSSVEAFEVLNPSNDEKSVILVVHSFEDDSQKERMSRSEQQFIDSKDGYFWTILWIEDINSPDKFKVLDSVIYRKFRSFEKRERVKIKFIGDAAGDGSLDIAVIRMWYTGSTYRIIKNIK